MQPNYAILILSYNHPDLTYKTIDAVLQKQFPANQVFLVHNGSEQKFVDQLKNQFQNIHHLIVPKNRGYTGGCNFGFGQVFQQYDAVFFLTNDTEVIHLPENFPTDSALITPLILKRKSEQIDSVAGAINTRTGQLRHLKDLQSLRSLTFPERAYAPGTAFGLTKKCFLAVGLFDETFHTYWEDVDFSLRAADLGYQIGFSDKFKLLHKIGKTCHKDRFYTLYLFQRNRRKLMAKHHYTNLNFAISYTKDMLRLLIKLLLKPNRLPPLKLWWKAIYD